MASRNVDQLEQRALGLEPFDPIAPLMHGRTLAMNNELRARMLCELAAGLDAPRRRRLSRAIAQHIRWAQLEALERRRVTESTWVILPPS